MLFVLFVYGAFAVGLVFIVQSLIGPDAISQRRSTPQQGWRQLLSLTKAHQQWWNSAKWVGVSAVGITGLLSALESILGGPPWPADPDIHAQNAANGSPLILPFTVHNRSVFFDMPNVQFMCGIDLVVFGDPTYQRRGPIGMFTDMAFVNGVQTVRAKQTVSFSCDATELIRAGGTTLAFGPANEPPNPAASPNIANILKMCVWIKGSYKLRKYLPRYTFTSAVFQYPAAPGVRQWLEEPIEDWRAPSKKEALARDIDHIAEANCSPSPLSPSMVLRNGKLEWGENFKW